MSSVLSPSPPAPPVAALESDQLDEVVDGVRVEKPLSAASVWIANELTASLKPHAKAEGFGTVVMEMVFVLDKQSDLRRRPDVAFLSSGKWPIGAMPTNEEVWEITPDLAIEVISPNNRFTEVLRKLHEYFEYGVQEVWLIAPEERLAQVYDTPNEMRTVRAGESLSTELIPNWSMPVATLIPETVAVEESPSE